MGALILIAGRRKCHKSVLHRCSEESTRDKGFMQREEENGNVIHLPLCGWMIEFISVPYRNSDVLLQVLTILMHYIAAMKSKHFIPCDFNCHPSYFAFNDDKAIELHKVLFPMHRAPYCHYCCTLFSQILSLSF